MEGGCNNVNRSWRSDASNEELFTPLKKSALATRAGTSAEPSAGVRDGMEAFVFGTTKTPANRAGEEESGVQALLTSPANFCSERNSGRLRPPLWIGAGKDPARQPKAPVNEEGFFFERARRVIRSTYLMPFLTASVVAEGRDFGVKSERHCPPSN